MKSLSFMGRLEISKIDLFSKGNKYIKRSKNFVVAKARKND